MSKYGSGKYGAPRKYGIGALTLKVLTFTATVAVSLIKKVKKVVVFTAKVTVVIVKKAKKVLSFTAVATQGIVKKAKKVLSVTATAAIGIVKKPHKVISVGINVTITLGKAIKKTIGIIVNASLNIIKKITKSVIQALVDVVLNAYKWWQVYPTLTVTTYDIEMEVIGMPYAGSTITLQGTFPDSAGDLTTLTGVTCKVYSPNRTLLTTLTPEEVSTGVYTAAYTIPATSFGQLHYEFSGTLGLKTILGRSTFDSNWR